MSKPLSMIWYPRQLKCETLVICILELCHSPNVIIVMDYEAKPCVILVIVLKTRHLRTQLKVAGILLRNVVTALSKKVKRIGKQKGKEIEELLKKQSASSSSVKANTIGKEKTMRSGQLLKQLAISLGTNSYQLAKQAGQKIKYTIKQDNLYYNNLVKGIQKIRTEKRMMICHYLILKL